MVLYIAFTIYLAMACFDVDGGSSSSHGHTDTETITFSPVLISSSHGHTAQAEPVVNVVSKFSGINLVPSLRVDNQKKENKKKNRKNPKNYEFS